MVGSASLLSGARSFRYRYQFPFPPDQFLGLPGFLFDPDLAAQIVYLEQENPAIGPVVIGDGVAV
jgi:hypothetical protein